MTYDDALNYIFSIKSFFGPPTLERMEKIMKYLGNPHKRLKFVHVAGTNGKGSTVSYISNALQKNGYKTGKFISPFIIDFRERIQINGEMISKENVLKYTKDIISAKQSADVELTQFEFVTCIGLLYFAESACDIVVLEVGLGGRFDATNIIENPLASAICSISLDHTAILGDTAEKIAFEKAGIIKQGGQVVCYPFQPEGVMNVFEWQTQKMYAKLIVPNIGEISGVDCTISSTNFTYKGEKYSLSLVGRYQIYNCITAIEVLNILENSGFNFQKNITIQALNEVRFPCRLERVAENPLIIIDGAHNPDAAQKLYSALSEFDVGKLTAIIGFMKDKDWECVMDTLCPLVEEFIAVQIDMPRSLPKQKISDYCSEIGKPCLVSNSVGEAITKAKNLGNTVLIFGSLYLASQARREFSPDFS